MNNGESRFKVSKSVDKIEEFEELKYSFLK